MHNKLCLVQTYKCIENIISMRRLERKQALDRERIAIEQLRDIQISIAQMFNVTGEDYVEMNKKINALTEQEIGHISVTESEALSHYNTTMQQLNLILKFLQPSGTIWKTNYPLYDKLKDALDSLDKYGKDIDKALKQTEPEQDSVRNRLEKITQDINELKETNQKLAEENNKLKSQITTYDQRHQEAQNKVVNLSLGKLDEDTAKQLIEFFNTVGIDVPQINETAQSDLSSGKNTRGYYEILPLPDEYNLPVSYHQEEELDRLKNEDKRGYGQCVLSWCLAPATYAGICELVWCAERLEEQGKKLENSTSDFFSPKNVCHIIINLIKELLSPDNIDEPWETKYQILTERLRLSRQENTPNFTKFLKLLKSLSQYGDTPPLAPYSQDYKRLAAIGRCFSLGRFVPKDEVLAKELENAANKMVSEQPKASKTQ